MTNHNNGDSDGDNDRNEDEDDDDNAASGSGSDGPILNPIATPWSRLDIVVEDQEMITTVVQMWRNMYLRIGIYLPYRYPIDSIVNMCHKLMYAKIGVLDLCC